VTSQIRTTKCGLKEARERLRTAHAYLLAAQLALTDDREEFAGVAVGNAVLAGIAAADSMCCKGLGKCSRSQDHRQAAELVESSSANGPSYRATLLRLLDLKDAAHYGFGAMSATDAKKAVNLAKKLVTGADTFVQT
jgi:hypothetical protein